MGQIMNLSSIVAEEKSLEVSLLNVSEHQLFEREFKVRPVEKKDRWEAPDWYGLAHVELKSVMQDVLEGVTPRLDMLQWIASGMVESLRWNDRLLHRVFTATSEQTLITNPIHVSVLSVRLGMELGWAPHHLERLALGGLMHDIGMCLLPRSILTKIGNLSLLERATMEQHPRMGAEVIKGIGLEYSWLEEVVLQAHERRDGSGYPNQIRGSDIHPYGYVIRLADVFDALTGVRLYRSRKTLSAAIRTILTEERRLFPRRLVKALIEQVTMYPLGTWVRLNTGEVGRVVDVNRGQPLRPVIMTTSRDGAGKSYLRAIDLRTEMWGHVVQVVR